MPPLKDQNNLHDIRQRLYERGAPVTETKRSTLSEATPKAQVERAWTTPPSVIPETLTASVPLVKKPRISYRLMVLLGAFALLFTVMLGTSLYLYLGNNQISSKNITIAMTGPLTIGGGEVYDLAVNLENKNDVAIESAVLIVNYPPGTKSAEEEPRDLLEERIILDTLAPGEVRPLSLKAVLFGEENQEHQIRATLEYRLPDSSGTFYKDADPLTLKIISSPLVMRVNSTQKVSAGQETEVSVTLQSNAPTALKDVLLAVEYPNNFEYVSADTEPAYRENTWLIDEIKPEGSITIKIKGSVSGLADEQFQLKFQAGTPQQSNQFIVGSILANGTADFVVEQPFIRVNLAVNDMEGAVVTMPTGDRASVEVTLTNTLADTLYDMAVEVKVAGNVLERDMVDVLGGYYDATKDIIRFDPSGNDTLTQVAPGATRKFRFSVTPGKETATPTFTLTANAFARRVSESSATEALVGTAKTEVKFTSSVEVARELGRGNTGFIESGPVPPQATVATTYTITLAASAGGNDVTGGVLTTALPQYVSWQNQTKGDGTIAFNPVTKELTWNVGDIEAGKEKQISFQVSLTPSLNQVGTTPALMTTQRFRATDRFTSTVVRDEALPLSTELSTEAGFEEGNGEIKSAP